MKASGLLKQQHDEVKSLFEEIKREHDKRSELLDRLASSLAGHMVIEQELFYPAVLEAKPDLVLESYEEHAVARFALKRLMKADPSEPVFEAKLTTLKELIEHHVEEEENDLFPAAESALGERSEELARKMKKLFDKTVAAGYERAIGKGGAAVTSAAAPSMAHH